MIAAKVCLSLWNLIFPPNNGVCRILATGDEVGIAYSQAIEGILAHPDLSQWEFLLTIESDNCPPSDGVLQLVEAMEQHPEYAAISGAYWTKGPSGIFQCWGSVHDATPNFMPQVPVPGTIQECCGLGMGFCLFRLATFKDARIPRPWFKTLASKDGVGTQDLAFWSQARKFGYRCAVAVECKVGHYDFEGKFGPPDFMW
jgi:hypothetical protein